jgi:CRISPR-associated RAMP protein (TIGR02581 family)
MTAISGHHTLQNRYRFEGRMELVSPLRLSSGRASDVTDAPLMRNRAGVPYIPGSSLRGALRSEMERILAGLGREITGVRSCVLFSQESGPDACVSVDDKKQKALKNQPEDKVLDYLDEHLCDLCRLFGSPAYASRLTLEDSLPENPANHTKGGNVRDGVGIDRDTGAARETIKFNYEVLEPEKGGTFFLLRMQVENLGVGAPQDTALLNLALSILQEGLYVGGKRAAGLGKICLRKESLKVRGFKNPKDLWRSLKTGGDPHRELSLEEVLNAEAPVV